MDEVAGTQRSVLVIDDHRSFAEMLALALDSVPGLHCVGLGHSAAEGIAMASRLQPDIVVMDIQMPNEDGLAATTRLRTVAPATVVAVVTAHTSPQWVSRAAQAGASAFVPKNGSLDEMIAVLLRAEAGQMVVAPSTYLAAGLTADVVVPPQLSDRELEVLKLLASGTSVTEMAPLLGITVHTCRGHVKAVRQKLDASTQLDAVLKARQLGLLDE